MITTNSGLRHPLNEEQTAASKFPAFVHRTVANYLAKEYDVIPNVWPGASFECLDFGYSGDGYLFLEIHFDSMYAKISNVCTDAGYKRAEFDATGMTLDSIRRRAADEAERLRQMYED